MSIGMILFQIFNAVSAVYIYLIFFESFSSKRNFSFRIPVILLVTLIWALALVLMTATIIRAFIIFILVVILSFTFNDVWYKRLLLSLLIFCLPGIMEVIVGMSFSLFGVNTSKIDKDLFLVIGTLISKLLTFTCVQFIRYKKHRFESINKWYYIAFILLTICSSLTVIMISDYLFLNQRYHMKVVAMISLWTLTISNFLIFYIIDKISNFNITEQNLMISKQLLKEQKLHYESVIIEQENIAKIRHDIKNSLIGVLSEYNSGNEATAKQRLKGMLDEISGINTETLCHDVALNTILIIKKKEALKCGIIFTCEDHINYEIKIDPIDLCVIVGNILDNAIDACKNISGKKYISVFISSNDSNLIVYVKNSVCERIDTKSLVTNKADKKLHGYGLPKIQELTEKYTGSITMDCDDEHFETNVILLNEQAKT